MRTVHDSGVPDDLNLLRVFAAVMAERHVTRAATRLGMTQSAVSHALGRLRRELGDPLVVRGRGGLVPTPRGARLAPAVARALDELEAAWRGDGFVPRQAARRFVVGAGDLAELVVLPALVARLARDAPGVSLLIRPVPEAPATALADGEVDAVLAPSRPADFGASCFQRQLFAEEFTCAMARRHPLARGKLTLDRYCDAAHLLVSPRGTPGSYVDDALAAIGRRRRVALAVPHFLVAPLVVATTELVATLPRRLAIAFTRSLGLALRPPPLAVGGFAMHAVWHQRTHDDPAHQWLREQIVAAAAAAPGQRRR